MNLVRTITNMERCSNESLEILCKKISEGLRKKLHDPTFIYVNIDKIENTHQLTMCIRKNEWMIENVDVILITINSISCHQKAVITSCFNYVQKTAEVLTEIGFTKLDSYSFDSMDYEY